MLAKDCSGIETVGKPVYVVNWTFQVTSSSLVICFVPDKNVSGGQVPTSKAWQGVQLNVEAHLSSVLRSAQNHNCQMEVIGARCSSLQRSVFYRIAIVLLLQIHPGHA